MVDGAPLLLILALLLRMAITLRTGDVFVSKNIGRLNVIAAGIVAMGVLSPWVRALTTHLLISVTDVSPAVPLAFDVKGAPILLGLLVAAPAETFRRGTKLRADTEGFI